MTVKELFLKEGFDAIMEALRGTHRNDHSIEATALYKEAFDALCALEFSGEGGEITFDVTPREQWFDEGSLPMLANGVEGELWENIVGKEIVKPEENPFTDAELAGAILWGATFYGFTSHDRYSPCDRVHTVYGKQAIELEQRLYRPYIRDKRVMRNKRFYDKDRFVVAFPQEVWDEIEYRQKHQNRQKRKRFYRLEKRISYLKRLDKRCYLICEIESITGQRLGDYTDKIIKAGTIMDEWRESHSSANVSRVEYLIDLLSNYFPQTVNILEDCRDSIVVCHTSTDFPLSDEECAKIENYLNTLNLDIRIKLLSGRDDSMGKELGLRFIGISDREFSEDDD